MFSPWQRINRLRDMDKYKREFKRARRHIEFVCELYRMQLEQGRLFLHEHPAQADSWEELCVQKLLRDSRVMVVDMDQCQFGQVSLHGDLVKKPTRWMSNCIEILEELDRRCSGRNGICSANNKPHAVCSGRTAREAAIYPFEMCSAILKGLRRHLDRQGRILPGVHGVLPRVDNTSMDESNTSELLAMLGTVTGDIYDATTGQLLKKELVEKARAEELKST